MREVAVDVAKHEEKTLQIGKVELPSGSLQDLLQVHGAN